MWIGTHQCPPHHPVQRFQETSQNVLVAYPDSCAERNVRGGVERHTEPLADTLIWPSPLHSMTQRPCGRLHCLPIHLGARNRRRPGAPALSCPSGGVRPSADPVRAPWGLTHSMRLQWFGWFLVKCEPCGVSVPFEAEFPASEVHTKVWFAPNQKYFYQCLKNLRSQRGLCFFPVALDA